MMTVVMTFTMTMMKMKTMTIIVTTILTTKHAKIIEIVGPMPGAGDEQVSAFVAAEHSEVSPNVAKYLAKKERREPVMVKRDAVPSR